MLKVYGSRQGRDEFFGIVRDPQNLPPAPGGNWSLITTIQNEDEGSIGYRPKEVLPVIDRQGYWLGKSV